MTLRRMTNLLQIYIISQFGCGLPNAKFPRDMPAKEKNKQLRYNLPSLISIIFLFLNNFFMYREALTRLNGTVSNVMRIATSSRSTAGMSFSSWEQEIQVEMVKAVRKGICPALREILMHGLVQPNKTTSLVPFLSCAVPRSGPSSDSCATTSHPWEIFVAFYRTKDGQSLMLTPQRSLAQSFSLEIQGGTAKQSLLVAIGNVIVMHQPYKRGPEAHFKAFLSSALK